MGAGASTLPSKLKEEDLQIVMIEMFNSFKDSDGYVDKELLIKAAYSGQEQEVFELFTKFSKNGNMDAKGFHDFCITAKLLNRTNFTVADSVRIFQKSITTLSTHQGTNVQTINYPIFRKFIIPDIAELKLLHIDNLIFKLSRIEANPPRLIKPTEEKHTEKREKKTQRTKSGGEDFDYGVPIVDVTDEADDQDILTPQRNTNTGTPVQNNAAIRIQSFSRMKTASRYVNELREVILF